jgi:dienelactone hydrolase
MPTRASEADDPLDDFDPRPITLGGVTKVVHVAGSGPGVIVMTEMPGISPHVARFSRWVRDAGFTVYMPSLFGRDGAVPQVEEGSAVLRTRRVRRHGGCGRWHGSRTSSAAVRASARSGCASRATSR